MKIYTEQSLRNFEFWSGAIARADIIKEKLGYDAFDTIENELEMDYPEGMSDTQINDLFWFDEDYIATLLGYRNWEHLENGDEPITIICTNIEWDVDEDEDETPEDLPTVVKIVLDDEDDIGDYLEAKENGDEDDFIANRLSDEYGYCVNSFEMEEDGE
jgi:hypothetical protein